MEHDQMAARSLLETQRQQNELAISNMNKTHKEELRTAMVKLQARYLAVQALSDGGCSLEGQMEALLRERHQNGLGNNQYQYAALKNQGNLDLRARLDRAYAEINALQGQINELQHRATQSSHHQATQGIMYRPEHSSGNTAGQHHGHAQPQHRLNFRR